MSDDADVARGVSAGLVYVGLVVALVALVIAVLAFVGGPGGAVPGDPSDRTFALSSDLVNGSNRYHPATLVAVAGDNLTFEVTNRGEDEHGFTVDGLGIADVVPEGETMTFTAEDVDAGIYDYYCQLHPGHIRGQLVVND